MLDPFTQTFYSMFDNYILKYICSKKFRYFTFRYFVTSHFRIFESLKYSQIKYFKSKSSSICFQYIQYPDIYLDIEKTALFVKLTEKAMLSSGPSIKIYKYSNSKARTPSIGSRKKREKCWKSVNFTFNVFF